MTIGYLSYVNHWPEDIVYKKGNSCVKIRHTILNSWNKCFSFSVEYFLLYYWNAFLLHETWKGKRKSHWQHLDEDIFQVHITKLDPAYAVVQFHHRYTSTYKYVSPNMQRQLGWRQGVTYRPNHVIYLTVSLHFKVRKAKTSQLY